MAVTYTSGEARPDYPDEPEVFVEYGWGPFHAFQRILAAEERLDLAPMKDYGGAKPWTDDLTPLRLLFDRDYVNGDHNVDAYPRMVSHLREIHSRWAASYPERDAPDLMKDLQLHSLEQLINVINTCRARGVHLRRR
jgi:hypothetical protein